MRRARRRPPPRLRPRLCRVCTLALAGAGMAHGHGARAAHGHGHSSGHAVRPACSSRAVRRRVLIFQTQITPVLTTPP